MRPVWHVFSHSPRGNMAAESYAGLQNTVTPPDATGRIIREKTNGGIDSLVVYLQPSLEKK